MQVGAGIMPSSESGSAGSDGNEESAAAVAGLGPGHAGEQDEDQRAREEMDRAMQDMLDEQEAEQVKKLEEMGLADKKEEQGPEEEEECEPTEEELLQQEAATWLQRTMRGHAARRRALFTPVWAPYPAPVRQMTWGYQGIFNAMDVEAVKKNYNFEEQVGLLDAVLAGGLGRLPHLHSVELVRPMVHRTERKMHLKALVEFCVDMGAAYARWGMAGQAEFMWQSAETLCLLPPCKDTNASKTMDACVFKGKTCYLVHAQDQLAMTLYKRGDYLGALDKLNTALESCLNGSVGRLPYYILQSHKATVLSAMGSHQYSLETLQGYIPSLNSAKKNPLGDLELIETGKIVSHLLVISFHNLSVQLAHLKRCKEAFETTAHVLSLVESGLHPAQPIRRHFVHAHSASLRVGKAGCSAPQSYSLQEADYEDPEGQSARKSMEQSSWSLDSSRVNAPKEGRWNRWLALAGKGRAVAPILVDLPQPDVETLAGLENAPKKGAFREYQMVLDAANEQFPKLDSMEECPAEVLGTVSRAILHFVQEGLHSNSNDVAEERYEQVQKLLDHDLFEHCGSLRWDVQVYGIMAKAYFCYNRLEDYEATLQFAQAALDRIPSEAEGVRRDYHEAVIQLCIGACLLRGGQHDDAFNLGKTALVFCHRLSDEKLQDPANRMQMEDILVAASQLMALAHIFLGNSEVALKLSQIAKDHIKNTSFSNKSNIQFMQVSRVHEITMSMNELKTDKGGFQSKKKKSESMWMDKISSLVFTKFVPGALHRNLPELYPAKRLQSRKQTRSHLSSGRSHSSLSIDFQLPGEQVVQDVLKPPEDAGSKSQKDFGVKRYKWTGKFSATLTDVPDLADASAIASVSMTALPVQESCLDGRTMPASPYAHDKHLMPPVTTNKQRSGRAKTPYGHLETSGLSLPPDSTRTGHPWVDELMHGKERKEEVRQRFASDPSAHLYFAKVYHLAKDQNSQLLDPTAKVMPRKKFAVGDHTRWEVGGSKGTPQSTRNPRQLLRDWGPDPTRLLRNYSRDTTEHYVRTADPARAQTVLGLSPERTIDMDMSGSTVGMATTESGRIGKLDLNEMRVLKHVPYDSVTRQSVLGLFVSKEERRSLLTDVDEYCIEKNLRPVTGVKWPEAEAIDWTKSAHATTRSSRDNAGGKSAKKETDVHNTPTRLYPTAKRESVSRPWHWSHAPEPSPYVHGSRFRALPWGQNLSPAARQAYGDNGSAAFGEHALASVSVSQQAMVRSADLSRKPEFAMGRAMTVSNVANRSLSFAD